MRVLALVLIGGLLTTAAPAFADTYTYTYTGNDYQVVSGQYTTSERVTVQLTLAAPLGPNLGTSTAQFAVSPLSFSFSDGVQTITNATPGIMHDSFDFATNAAGTPSAWNVGVLQLQPVGMTNQLNSIQTTGSPSLQQDAGVSSGEGSNTFDPGSWALTVNAAPPVPEPGPLGLVVTGCLGLSGAVRRRR